MTTMLPGQVEDVLTPCDPVTMFFGLQEAWRELFNEEPTRASLLVLLAQSTEECGAGYKSAHAFNYGNVKHVEGDGHAWVTFPCDERKPDGTRYWLYPPDPGCRFVAWPDRATGIREYLKQLHGRFRAAWPALLTGDPDAFVRALKAQKYFTADVEVYARAVSQLVRQYDRTIREPAPESLPPNPDGARILRIARGVDAGEEGLPDEPPPEAA